MSEAYRAARLDEIGIDGRPRIPIRKHFGISAFGVNGWSADAGQSVIGVHDERRTRHEELYLVVSGRARFTLDGEELDAPQGMLVAVTDPAVTRAAVALEDGTTILALGGEPGRPFAVSGWERWSEAEPHYRAGDYARAIEVAQQLLKELPDEPTLLYNLACCESLADRPAEALEHLRRAGELDPSVLEWAKTDSDLDAIRRDVSAVSG